MNKAKTDWFMVFWVVVMALGFIYSFAKWWYCW